jgi:hypothetical protein
VLEATGNALAIARIVEPPCGSRCARQPESGQERDAVEAEDGQARRARAREAARRWLSARGVDARRTDACPAQAGLAPPAIGAPADTREETGARDPDPQSEGTLAGRRPLRRRRRWLAAQRLPVDEREMVEACLRGIDFLDGEIAAIDRALARLVLGSGGARAAAHPARRQLRHRLRTAGGDRRRATLPERPPAGQLPPGSTSGYISLAPNRPDTAGSPSKAPARRGPCSSRWPDAPPAQRDRSAPSTSGSPSEAAAMSPPSRSPASWP